MDAINIQVVLNEIKTPGGRTFALEFVRGRGTKRGSIKKVARCLYGSPKSRAANPRGKPGGKANKKYLYSGTIPLTDIDAGLPITPFISHIIKYNGQPVVH